MTSEKIIVHCDGHPNLRFSGTVLGKATTKKTNSTRWVSLTLYRTARGKYVASRVHVTCWQGESDRFEATVCQTVDDVIGFFGHSDVAKELYEAAGIDADCDVDGDGDVDGNTNGVDAG